VSGGSCWSRIVAEADQAGLRASIESDAAHRPGLQTGVSDLGSRSSLTPWALASGDIVLKSKATAAETAAMKAGAHLRRSMLPLATSTTSAPWGAEGHGIANDADSEDDGGAVAGYVVVDGQTRRRYKGVLLAAVRLQSGFPDC